MKKKTVALEYPINLEEDKCTLHFNSSDDAFQFFDWWNGVGSDLFIGVMGGESHWEVRRKLKSMMKKVKRKKIKSGVGSDLFVKKIKK